MLSARAIYRLLIEDDPPVTPGPDDPNQLPLGFNQDELLDPKSEIMRMADQGPLSIPGREPPRAYQRMLAQLGNRPRRKIANATYLILNGDGSIASRYHDTDVVTAYPDGKVVIDSGGWRPTGAHGNHGWKMPAGTTTMLRINDWLSGTWQIYRTPMPGVRSGDWEGGEWYWYNRGENSGYAGYRLLFNDGDIINPDGSLQLKEEPVPIEPKRKRGQ